MALPSSRTAPPPLRTGGQRHLVWPVPTEYFTQPLPLQLPQRGYAPLFLVASSQSRRLRNFS